MGMEHQLVQEGRWTVAMGLGASKDEEGECHGRCDSTD